MTKREDPDGQVSIGVAHAMLAMKYGPGGRFSGAQILDFQAGWAIPAFHFGAVHHLRIVGDEALAKCGWRTALPLVRNQGVVFFGQGQFKRCVKCQRVVDRKLPV